MTHYKFTAVLNKKIETGKAMNALAHMTAGLVGSYEHLETMEMINYADKDGGVHRASKHPFIILSAKNSNKLRTLQEEAIERGVHFASFTDAMTVGTWEEQIAKSQETTEEDLEYYGVCVFGLRSDIEEITKKFSLFGLE
jgi:hypothetical protein